MSIGPQDAPTDVPLISIGMPVYNGEPWLPASIESILAQSYSALELIISDNASADRTREICERYGHSDKRIRYYRNDINVGAAENYNRTFRYAAGKYFKWAAADDLLAPDFIERCVTPLERDPLAVLSYPRTAIIDSAGTVLLEVHNPTGVDVPDPLARFKSFNSTVGECNAVFGLIRRDLLARTALIGRYISSDTHLLAELTLLGRFVEIPAVLFFRRVHPLSSSYDRSTEAQLQFFDPVLRDKVVLSQWQGLAADMLAITRAPLGLGGKLRLYRYLIQQTLWSRGEFVAEARIGLGRFIRTRGFLRSVRGR